MVPKSPTIQASLLVTYTPSRRLLVPVGSDFQTLPSYRKAAPLAAVTTTLSASRPCTASSDWVVPRLTGLQAPATKRSIVPLVPQANASAAVAA
jgi:hypothetical protein